MDSRIRIALDVRCMARPRSIERRILGDDRDDVRREDAGDGLDLGSRNAESGHFNLMVSLL